MSLVPILNIKWHAENNDKKHVMTGLIVVGKEKTKKGINN